MVSMGCDVYGDIKPLSDSSKAQTSQTDLTLFLEAKNNNNIIEDVTSKNEALDKTNLSEESGFEEDDFGFQKVSNRVHVKNPAVVRSLCQDTSVDFRSKRTEDIDHIVCKTSSSQDDVSGNMAVCNNLHHNEHAIYCPEKSDSHFSESKNDSAIKQFPHLKTDYSGGKISKFDKVRDKFEQNGTKQLRSKNGYSVPSTDVTILASRSPESHGCHGGKGYITSKGEWNRICALEYKRPGFSFPFRIKHENVTRCNLDSKTRSSSSFSYRGETVSDVPTKIGSETDTPGNGVRLDLFQNKSTLSQKIKTHSTSATENKCWTTDFAKNWQNFPDYKLSMDLRFRNLSERPGCLLNCLSKPRKRNLQSDSSTGSSEMKPLDSLNSKDRARDHLKEHLPRSTDIGLTDATIIDKAIGDLSNGCIQECQRVNENRLCSNHQQNSSSAKKTSDCDIKCSSAENTNESTRNKPQLPNTQNELKTNVSSSNMSGSTVASSNKLLINDGVISQKCDTVDSGNDRHKSVEVQLSHDGLWTVYATDIDVDANVTNHPIERRELCLKGDLQEKIMDYIRLNAVSSDSKIGRISQGRLKNGFHKNKKISNTKRRQCNHSPTINVHQKDDNSMQPKAKLAILNHVHLNAICKDVQERCIPEQLNVSCNTLSVRTSVNDLRLVSNNKQSVTLPQANSGKDTEFSAPSSSCSTSTNTPLSDIQSSNEKISSRLILASDVCVGKNGLHKQLDLQLHVQDDSQDSKLCNRSKSVLSKSVDIHLPSAKVISHNEPAVRGAFDVIPSKDSPAANNKYNLVTGKTNSSNIVKNMDNSNNCISNTKKVSGNTCKASSRRSTCVDDPLPSSVLSLLQDGSNCVIASQILMSSQCKEAISTDRKSGLVIRHYHVGSDVMFGLVHVEKANSNGYNGDNQSLVTIRIQPDDQGRFGFNVKGGADQGMPIIVSRVAPNTPADLCMPRLNEGDQVLFINDRGVSQHTHEQVVMFIRASRETHSGELQLIVRPNVYVGEDMSEEPDFMYIPETHQIISSAGGNALDASLMLLNESLESNAALAQFEQLYRKKPGLTMISARIADNIPKNRYRDISPYDQTRVVLKGCQSTDYVNANFVNMEIPGSGIVNRYIAAQGPLPNTCVDFWQMVWEQQSSLVVMLTAKVERGRPKCHQYWPDLYETTDFGTLQITCVKEEENASFAFREFTLTHVETNEERHIVHMQYIAWPDHGVPDDSSDFLDFVLKVRQNRVGMVEPTVVHCSAGIGRTGVLITMETAMCLIEANQAVYPLVIVRQMRDQRAMLIQTASQYKFVCEAILRVYNEGLVKPLDDYRR